MKPRRRVGLRTRVVASFALLSAMLSLFLSGATYFLIQASTLERREAVARSLAFSNARLVREQLLIEGADGLDQLDNVLQRRPIDGTVVLTYGDSTTVSASAFSQASFDPGRDIPAPLRAAVQNRQTVIQRTQLNGEPVLFIGVPIRLSTAAPAEQAAADAAVAAADAEPGSPTITQQSGTQQSDATTSSLAEPAAPAFKGDWAEYYEVSSLADIEDTFDTLVVALIAADGLTTLAGALVGRWISRRVLAPLHDVNTAVRALATMTFDTKLPPTRDPDLAPLVSTFNQTVEALQDRIDRDGRFASDVSHELRSPLTTLVASVAVLEQHEDVLPEPAQRAVRLLSEEFQRFQQLVGDLLEISRFDAGAQHLDRSPLVVGEFVRFAVGMTCQGEVAVTIDPDLEEAVIMADKRRLVQVLSNLVSNADKYADGVREVDVSRVRGGVELRVMDRGPGVPEEDQERIFDRFARGVTAGRRGSDQGTGLGLALVSEHVRLHGGTVRVQDRPDGASGACFTVFLPANPVSIYDSEADFEAAGFGADL
ncbi:MAG: ATP-binding protein [Acidimicrobiales bacterium]